MSLWLDLDNYRQLENWPRLCLRGLHAPRFGRNLTRLGPLTPLASSPRHFAVRATGGSPKKILVLHKAGLILPFTVT